MAWQTQHSDHSGWIAHVFSDGSFGSVWRRGGPEATHRANGQPYDQASDFVGHSAKEIVGYRAVCTDYDTGRLCWRGTLWPVSADGGVDVDAQVLNVPAAPGRQVDPLVRDRMRQEWNEHAEPLDVWDVLEAHRSVRVAQNRLTEAVRSARSRGVTWEAIGRAAGRMTRQSAQERWSKLM